MAEKEQPGSEPLIARGQVVEHTAQQGARVAHAADSEIGKVAQGGNLAPQHPHAEGV
jgi:hypothetical protein